MNERLVRATARRVDVACDGFPAGARLPADQDRCFRRRRGFRLALHLPDGLAVAQDLRVPRQLAEQRAVPLLETPLAERVSQDQQRLFERQRLFYEIESAQLRRLER